MSVMDLARESEQHSVSLAPQRGLVTYKNDEAFASDELGLALVLARGTGAAIEKKSDAGALMAPTGTDLAQFEQYRRAASYVERYGSSDDVTSLGREKTLTRIYDSVMPLEAADQAAHSDATTRVAMAEMPSYLRMAMAAGSTGHNGLASALIIYGAAAYAARGGLLRYDSRGLMMNDPVGGRIVDGSASDPVLALCIMHQGIAAYGTRSAWEHAVSDVPTGMFYNMSPQKVVSQVLGHDSVMTCDYRDISHYPSVSMRYERYPSVDHASSFYNQAREATSSDVRWTPADNARMNRMALRDYHLATTYGLGDVDAVRNAAMGVSTMDWGQYRLSGKERLLPASTSEAELTALPGQIGFSSRLLPAPGMDAMSADMLMLDAPDTTVDRYAYTLVCPIEPSMSCAASDFELG